MFTISPRLSLLVRALCRLMQRNVPSTPKILVIGLAKSGTSIMMYRISGGLTDPAEFFEPGGFRGQMDVDFHRRVTSSAKPVVTKLVYHVRKPECFEEILPLYDKVVWIIRDPRDRLISNFFYRWFHPNANEAAFQDALKMVRKKEASPGEVPFHSLTPMLKNVRQCTSMYDPMIEIIERFKPIIYRFYYEDLIRGRWDGLESWLGSSLSTEAVVKGKAIRVSRSHTFENWRRWFCPEDVAIYRPWFSEYLEALGYSADDWELTPVSTLPPEEGSEYMIRLFNRAH